jgi:50S ribosomal protein L16 3-hydroxylase
LLVQDVDKHLPALRARCAPAAIIPAWRIDDLMVSVAAPGGSVGPHRDNYDVFLCQGDGSRDWFLGDPTSVDIDDSSHELSLLMPFAAESSCNAAEGDVLYIPPGIPHWGIARNLCVTYSIGFRAPAAIELRLACQSLYPESCAGFETPADEAQRFYADPDLQVGEAAGGLIAPRCIARIREQRLLPATLRDNEIADVLGVVATDVKAWLAPESMTRPEANDWLQQTAATDVVAIHGMARIAACIDDGIRLFFANGHSFRLEEAQLQLALELCAGRQVRVAALTAATAPRKLAAWLLEHGAIDVT